MVDYFTKGLLFLKWDLVVYFVNSRVFCFIESGVRGVKDPSWSVFFYVFFLQNTLSKREMSIVAFIISW